MKKYQKQCEHKNCKSTEGRDYVKITGKQWDMEPEFFCNKHSVGRKPVIYVYTKELQNGTFSCYATIRGYDYSYIDNTPDGAQKQMKNMISKDIEQYFFFPVIEYVHIQKEKKRPIRQIKIDNL